MVVEQFCFRSYFEDRMESCYSLCEDACKMSQNTYAEVSRSVDRIIERENAMREVLKFAVTFSVIDDCERKRLANFVSALADAYIDKIRSLVFSEE